MKLFGWRDPQSPYPADALRVHARDVRGLLIRSAAVDRPGAYQLFDVDRGAARRAHGPAPVAHLARARAPARPLRPGRYMIVASHEGMFGDRDFIYVSGGGAGRGGDADRRRLEALGARRCRARCCPSRRRCSPRSSRSCCCAPSGAGARGQKLLWAGGFLLFAVATACEAVAQGSGWSPGLFRGYYLCGGVLTVAWLGAGSAWLLLPARPRRARRRAAVATVAAAAAVVLAPVHAGALAHAPSGGPPVDSALGGHAFIWAIALNSFGTVFLLGGALYSMARRRRVRANLWIAGGALVLALSTSMTRAGEYSLVYVGELVGIALMFAGFNLTGSGGAAPRPSAPAGAVPRAVATP